MVRLSRHTQAQNEELTIRRLHTHRYPRVEIVGAERRGYDLSSLRVNDETDSPVGEIVNIG